MVKHLHFMNQNALSIDTAPPSELRTKIADNKLFLLEKFIENLLVNF